MDTNDIEQAGLLASDAEKGQADISGPQQPQHHEDTVSMDKKLWYLLGYFICNIGLTLYNKAILGSVSHVQPRVLVLRAARRMWRANDAFYPRLYQTPAQ
jgi:hypothetical protein